jgi:hypothetical protein
MSQQKAPMWFVAGFFACLHFLALAALLFYCLDQYYDQPETPVDPIICVLFPAAFFFPTSIDNPVIGIAAILTNSVVWGYALALVFGRWFCWPPSRWTLAAMLSVMAMVGVVLGLVFLNIG